MVERVSSGVLRYGLAQMRADAEEACGTLAWRRVLDRKASQHAEAAAVQQLLSQALQHRVQSRQLHPTQSWVIRRAGLSRSLIQVKAHRSRLRHK